MDCCVSRNDQSSSGEPIQRGPLWGTPPEQVGLAQRMNVESQVDCVLIGSVVGQASQKSFAGLKERSSQRLYLYLVNDSGTLMWKTELPYTICNGSQGSGGGNRDESSPDSCESTRE